jgi:hypothetical protein
MCLKQVPFCPIKTRQNYSKIDVHRAKRYFVGHTQTHLAPPLSLRKQPPLRAWGPAKVSWPRSVCVERALCKHSHTHSHATAHHTRFSLCLSRPRLGHCRIQPHLSHARHTTLRSQLCRRRTRSSSEARRKSTSAQPVFTRPFGLASYIIFGNYILKSSTLSPSLGNSINPAHSHSRGPPPVAAGQPAHAHTT